MSRAGFEEVIVACAVVVVGCVFVIKVVMPIIRSAFVVFLQPVFTMGW